LHLIIVVELFPSETFLHFVTFCRFITLPYKQQKYVCEFPLDVHLLRWEIVWRNAPSIWRDFGSELPLQTRLTQTKPVLPLSKEHGSQVKGQGRRKCCHNKHKKYPIGLHVMYLYFPDTHRTSVNQTATQDSIIMCIRVYSTLLLSSADFHRSL
jgi:hypothetical protein